MTDISPEYVERWEVTHNANGLGFSDGIRKSPHGNFVSLEDYRAQAARIADLEDKLHQSESTRRAQIKTIRGEKKKRLAAWNDALDAAVAKCRNYQDWCKGWGENKNASAAEAAADECASVILALKTETPT